MNFNRIFETTDYNQFDWTEINRDIVESQVKKLEADIDSGMAVMTPILVNPEKVNGKLQFPDGQHRLVALKNKNRPIRYVFATRQMDLNDITRINTQQRPWSTMDYIKAFAKAGKQDYVRLLNFYEEVQERIDMIPNVKRISVRAVSFLAQGDATNPNTAGIFKIKDGTWKFRSTEKQARKNLNMFIQFAEITGSCLTECFIQTIFSMIKHQDEFNVNRLLRQAKAYPHLFYSCSRNQDYMRMIEELYNHRKMSNNRVYFRFRTKLNA